MSSADVDQSTAARPRFMNDDDDDSSRLCYILDVDILTRKLAKAAARGRVRRCMALVRAGADVNGTEDGEYEYWPLLQAARANHADLCRLLMHVGADPKNNLYGVLHILAECPGVFPGTFDVLIDCGADPSTYVEDPQVNVTPIHVAAKEGRIGACRVMLNRLSPEVTAEILMNDDNDDDESPLDSAVRRFASVDLCRVLLTTTDADTAPLPLHRAAALGHAGACDLLLRSGNVSVTELDNTGLTAMQHAVQHYMAQHMRLMSALAGSGIEEARVAKDKAMSILRMFIRYGTQVKSFESLRRYHFAAYKILRKLRRTYTPPPTRAEQRHCAQSTNCAQSTIVYHPLRSKSSVRGGRVLRKRQ